MSESRRDRGFESYSRRKNRYDDRTSRDTGRGHGRGYSQSHSRDDDRGVSRDHGRGHGRGDSRGDGRGNSRGDSRGDSRYVARDARRDDGDRSGGVDSGRKDEPSFRSDGRDNRNRKRIGRSDKFKRVVMSYLHKGVFEVQDEQNTLVTKSLVPGIPKYGEKRIYVVDKISKEKIEYRVWDPFKSKLAAAIRKGIRNIYIKPGSKVLYLGAASGTAVSHVADIVGLKGTVFAVESVQRHVRQLIEVAQKRSNIIPIIEEVWHPYKYRMLLEMVDVIVSDVARPDQVEILAKNAQSYLKADGYFVIFIKVSYIDPSAKSEDVFNTELCKLKEKNLICKEQMSFEERDEQDNYVVVGVFKPKFENVSK